MSSEIITKEKKAKEAEKMYTNLREVVAKQPGPEVIMHLSRTRSALRNRAKKMKVKQLKLSLINNDPNKSVKILYTVLGCRVEYDINFRA